MGKVETPPTRAQALALVPNIEPSPRAERTGPAAPAPPAAKPKDRVDAQAALPIATALPKAMSEARKEALSIGATNFLDNIADAFIVLARWIGLTSQRTRTFDHVADGDQWLAHAAALAGAGGETLRRALDNANDQECVAQLSALITASNPLPATASEKDRQNRTSEVTSAAQMALTHLREIYAHANAVELALVAPALNGPTLDPSARVELARLLSLPRQAKTHALITLAIRDCPECARPPLPDRVVFKTKTEAITPFFFYAVRDGRLWMKPNPDSGESGPWRVLDNGRPDKWYWRHQPNAIRAISADGSFLVAQGDDGVFYSLRWSTLGVTGWGSLIAVGRGPHVWSDSWGFPLDLFSPKLSTDKRKFSDFHMSSRTRHNAGYCEDGNGYHHRFDFGCDEVITLSADGTMFDGIDPWLGANYHLLFASPHQGKTHIISYDSSASTHMAMDDHGHIYTRMFDFDVSGQDHYFFGYTWADNDSHYMRRRLPLPDWVEQPPVPGQTTSKLTITVTPGQKGNAARTLVVEGIDAQGHTGYFTKGITDKAWTFVPTGERLSGKLVIAPAPNPAATTTASQYDLVAHGTLGTAAVSLADFNLYGWQASTLKVGDATLALHASEIKDIDEKNGSATVLGAFTIDDPALLAKLPPELAKAFGKQKFVEIEMAIGKKTVMIKPANGTAFALSLSVDVAPEVAAHDIAEPLPAAALASVSNKLASVDSPTPKPPPPKNR